MGINYIEIDEYDKLSKEDNVLLVDENKYNPEDLLVAKSKILESKTKLLGTAIKCEDYFMLSSEKTLDNNRMLTYEQLDELMTKRKQILTNKTFERRYKTHHDVDSEFAELLETQSYGPNQIDIRGLKATEKSAIYIHVPFCDKICSFCNLQRTKKTDEIYMYAEDLVCDINSYKESELSNSTEIESIYFGGGTPTTLNEEMLTKIINALKDSFKLSKTCEISIETTLHNLSLKKLELLKLLGVNRLSFGIQTFDDEGRKFFNRTGSKDYTVKKLKEIRDNFDGVISIDIIYNYPSQTLERLKEDIDTFQQLNIDSVSYYSLMIHKGSNLSEDYEKSELVNKYDEIFHDYFIDELILSDKRFSQNEITKICDEQKDKYKYIDLRHRAKDVIPFGKGAGGNIGEYGIYRMDTTMYVSSKITNFDHVQIKLLKGITQRYKFNLNEVKRSFNEKQIKRIVLILEDLVASGFYFKQDESYYQTKIGTFYGNNLSAYLAYNYIKGEIDER